MRFNVKVREGREYAFRCSSAAQCQKWVDRLKVYQRIDRRASQISLLSHRQCILSGQEEGIECDRLVFSVSCKLSKSLAGLAVCVALFGKEIQQNSGAMDEEANTPMGSSKDDQVGSASWTFLAQTEVLEPDVSNMQRNFTLLLGY